MHTGVYVTMPASAFDSHRLETELIVRYQQGEREGSDSIQITLPRPKEASTPSP